MKNILRVTLCLLLLSISCKKQDNVDFPFFGEYKLQEIKPRPSRLCNYKIIGSDMILYPNGEYFLNINFCISDGTDTACKEMNGSGNYTYSWYVEEWVTGYGHFRHSGDLVFDETLEMNYEVWKHGRSNYFPDSIEIKCTDYLIGYAINFYVNDSLDFQPSTDGSICRCLSQF